MLKKKFLILIVLNLLIPPANAENPAQLDTTTVLTLRWLYNTKMGITDVNVVDLDDDGIKEIIGGSYDGKIYALNHTGELRWKYSTLCSVYSTAVGDLEGDGKLDFAVGSCGEIHTINSSGNLRWKYSIKKPVFSLLIDDVDGDGVGEVVAGASALYSTSINVISANGKTRWSDGFKGGPVSEIILLNDGSKSKNIFVGVDDVLIYGPNGSLKNKFDVGGKVKHISVHTDDKGETNLLVGVRYGALILDSNGNIKLNHTTRDDVEDIKAVDLEGDGTTEYLIGSDQLYVLDDKGGLIWNYTTGKIVHSISTGDFDRDGFMEVVVGSDKIYVLNSTGTLLEAHRTYRDVVETMVVDLEGDGFPELVVGALDRNIYLYRVRTKLRERLEAELGYRKAYESFTAGDYIPALREAEISRDSFMYVGDVAGMDKAILLVYECVEKIVEGSRIKGADENYLKAEESLKSGDTETSLSHATAAQKIYLMLNDSKGIKKTTNFINQIQERFNATQTTEADQKGADQKETAPEEIKPKQRPYSHADLTYTNILWLLLFLIITLPFVVLILLQLKRRTKKPTKIMPAKAASNNKKKIRKRNKSRKT